MNIEAIDLSFIGTLGFLDIFFNADIIDWLSFVSMTLQASAKNSLFLEIANLIRG